MPWQLTPLAQRIARTLTTPERVQAEAVELQAAIRSEQDELQSLQAQVRSAKLPAACDTQAVPYTFHLRSFSHAAHTEVCFNVQSPGRPARLMAGPMHDTHHHLLCKRIQLEPPREHRPVACKEDVQEKGPSMRLPPADQAH